MRALILMDSFKGTLSSLEAGHIVQSVLNTQDIQSDVFSISDGGEGFLDSIAQNNTITKHMVNVYDPLFRPIDVAYYGIREKAYIELARSSGLTLVEESLRNPFITSTYGLGQVIKNAIQMGYRKVVIGIGGSATNDGGTGMLEAMGALFYNQHHQRITHLNGKQLQDIQSIDFNPLFQLIEHTIFEVCSDVSNPLLGKKGATYTFGYQKGATPEIANQLEVNMTQYDQIMQAYFKTNYANQLGSGAAGGVGYALQMVCRATRSSGIDTILNQINVQKAEDYDLIITGEGRFDSQSLDGKVLSGVMRRFNTHPIVVICGVKTDVKIDRKQDIFIYSIVPTIASLDESLKHPPSYLRRVCETIDFRKYKKPRQ